MVSRIFQLKEGLDPTIGYSTTQDIANRYRIVMMQVPNNRVYGKADVGESTIEVAHDLNQGNIQVRVTGRNLEREVRASLGDTEEINEEDSLF